ncbi:SpoIIE family protein phosphatase [Frisingicoccus sp.]|uniref:SpoIIE family protein phosphatase n=1 Tax=Frisingicoccus sp. TaxID=1918627 RepID=UPI002EBE6DE9|nr:SpoIIE family protein phosphatase [Frisingicoccus sp.]
MNRSLDIAWKSLNKAREELCGDTVEIIRSEDSDILVLSDGMGSGVKANILSTLTTKIMGTMLKNGASIEECVTTVAKTLPVCQTRQVAYSTFSVLKIDKNGEALLLEYDNPGGILIRDGHQKNIPFNVREIEGKIIREYHFNVCYGDYYIMMSDGVVHAGVGTRSGFGWPRSEVVEYVEKLCADDISSSRLMSMISNHCNELYDGKPGDDTTVIAIKVTEPKTVNLFTGPPVNREDDERVMEDFFSVSGTRIVCGGTSANIVSRYLGKPIKASLTYYNPDIPPTAEIEGMDLVTEGVLTLNHTVQLLHSYNKGEVDEGFFNNLYDLNGASRLTKVLIEECSHLNLFVGKAINSTYQAAALSFDLSIRQRLVEQLISECREMGKIVTIKYY